jgi:hypothetical protein
VSFDINLDEIGGSNLARRDKVIEAEEFNGDWRAIVVSGLTLIGEMSGCAFEVSVGVKFGGAGRIGNRGGDAFHPAEVVDAPVPF